MTKTKEDGNDQDHDDDEEHDDNEDGNDEDHDDDDDGLATMRSMMTTRMTMGNYNEG